MYGKINIFMEDIEIFQGKYIVFNERCRAATLKYERGCNFKCTNFFKLLTEPTKISSFSNAYTSINVIIMNVLNTMSFYAITMP